VKKTFGERLKSILLPANPVINAVLWGTIAMAGVLAVFFSYYLPRNFFAVEGEVSDVTIEANKSVTYEDTAKTGANRQAAADRVSDIFVFDHAILAEQIRQLDQLFRAWEELALLPETPIVPALVGVEGADEQGAGAEESGDSAASGGRPSAAGDLLSAGGAAAASEAEGEGEGEGVQEHSEAIVAETKLERAAPYIAQLQIRESTAEAVLAMDSISLQALRGEGVAIMTQQWTKGVRSEEIEEARKKILDEVYIRISNEDQASFLQAAFRFISLGANFIFDEETTERARVEAAGKEPPVYNSVYRNQKVIGKGEIVTANHIEMLKALGYQRSDAPYVILIGLALFTGCIFFLLSRYMKQFPLKNLSEGKHNALLALMFLLILGLARLIVAVNISPEQVVAEQVAYLIPASTGAILVAILLDNWLGVLFGAFASIYVGLLSGGGLSYAVAAFAGCLIGVYGISRYTKRSEWAKAGLLIALVNVWIIVGSGIMNNLDRMVVLYGVALGVVNGFLAPILAYGSLPFLESAFQITTSVSLMELSDPRQPLLKELSMNAPGTYHHSTLVGNLAEAAADEIGADPVLVRAGAYYHDVGKLKRPYFFVENQLSDSNPHEKLTPALSALILSSHVKDGLEIGRKYKLPEKILDFIPQHHGDGIMAYFYHKAVEEAGGPEKVKESDFRYPGPRPRSRETALVSLADSVEAAVRSMHVSGDALEAAVKRIINNKVSDGQLDDSQLSINDIKVVGQVFTKVLTGIYHNRVEYPDNVQALMRRDDDKPAEMSVESPPSLAPADAHQIGKTGQ
jgi:putative nucleotidyltransferase with HDIG domain